MGSTLAILASGSGTTLEAIADACGDGRIAATVARVVVDRPCGAVDRARRRGIPVTVVERRRFAGEGSAAIVGALAGDRPDLIILAGFLSILTEPLLGSYAGRIVNIHPSLLPRHGGAGMYGLHVHRAVLAAGDDESGCTVHFVDAGTDTGPIIAQARCPVLADDSPESLAARVQALEKPLLVATVADLVARRAR